MAIGDKKGDHSGSSQPPVGIVIGGLIIVGLYLQFTGAPAGSGGSSPFAFPNLFGNSFRTYEDEVHGFSIAYPEYFDDKTAEGLRDPTTVLVATDTINDPAAQERFSVNVYEGLLNGVRYFGSTPSGSYAYAYDERNMVWVTGDGGADPSTAPLLFTTTHGFPASVFQEVGRCTVRDTAYIEVPAQRYSVVIELVRNVPDSPCSADGRETHLTDQSIVSIVDSFTRTRR